MPAPVDGLRRRAETGLAGNGFLESGVIMKTGLYYDPLFLQHDTGSHPENAGRLTAIMDKLKQDHTLDALQARTSRAATEEEVAAVHGVDYIRHVEEAALAGQEFLGTPDCVLSEQTYDVALHAAGALVDAVEEVAERRLDNAFVACRPPGHHAEANQAMGFCYFNNVAIAAEHLIRHAGLERVLIFDFDVHHGNGTQHTFEARKDIYFCSMHQHPRTLYPGTGYAEERGRGEGVGYTLNVPMLPFSTDADYLLQFDSLILPRFREYAPQMILLSAGFDAHRDDPLAMVNLTQAGFDGLTERMKRLADEVCGGKIVSVLEGGYNYQRLSECVASHVAILNSDRN
jgi:acetoin utilization deacetylase AcuC-like enzyme